MAIIVTLDHALHDRRMSLTELAEKVGLTLANLSILKTGKARAIRFSTLNAICDALQCQPGELLRFEPDSGDSSGSEDRDREISDPESYAPEEEGVTR